MVQLFILPWAQARQAEPLNQDMKNSEEMCEQVSIKRLY